MRGCAQWSGRAEPTEPPAGNKELKYLIVCVCVCVCVSTHKKHMYNYVLYDHVTWIQCIHATTVFRPF